MVEPLLTRLRARARAEWPELGTVTDEELESFILARIPADKIDPDTRAEDLLLACACAKGIRAAHDLLQELVELDLERVHTRIRPPISLREAVQQVEKRLFAVPEGGVARITLYKGDIDLVGYVRNFASRMLLALASRAKPRPDSIEDNIIDGNDGFSTARNSTDPELERVKRNYLPGLRLAITHAVAELEPRERALLRYVMIDQLGPDALGLMYATNPDLVATWLQLARDRLELRIKHCVAERLRVSDRDHAVIATFVIDQLDSLFTPILTEA